MSPAQPHPVCAICGIWTEETAKGLRRLSHKTQGSEGLDKAAVFPLGETVVTEDHHKQTVGTLAQGTAQATAHLALAEQCLDVVRLVLQHLATGT